MLKVCFCIIVLSFYTLQVKSQAAPKAPSAQSSLAAPKEPSTPKISAAPVQPTVDANVNFNVEAATDAQCKGFPAPKVPTAPKEPDTPKEPSTPKVSASLKLSKPTVDANANLKKEACAPIPDGEPSSKQYNWEEYKGTIPSNAMPASDDPNDPVYLGLAEPERYNCSFAIRPSEKTRKDFECGMVQVKKNDKINILTVTDKKKFKWQPVNKGNFSDIDAKDLVETNYQPHQGEEFSRWYLGRMKEADGTFEVGDIIYKQFYSSKKRIYISEGFEALVRSNITDCS